MQTESVADNPDGLISSMGSASFAADSSSGSGVAVGGTGVDVGGTGVGVGGTGVGVGGIGVGVGGTGVAVGGTGVGVGGTGVGVGSGDEHAINNAPETSDISAANIKICGDLTRCFILFLLNSSSFDGSTREKMLSQCSERVHRGPPSVWSATPRRLDVPHLGFVFVGDHDVCVSPAKVHCAIF